ncbi:MAG: LysE family translocator [Planctomycetota bacterium]
MASARVGICRFDGGGMTSPEFLCFVSASAALTIAPGPDNTFIVAQGLSRGRRAAVITALGMCSGVSVHTTAAALGISAVIVSSAVAFRALKYAGAAYLLYLAWRAVREPAGALPTGAGGGPGGWAFFRRGFLMNVINPKVALFFLAFLPQFVSGADGPVAARVFLLGGIFMGQAMIIFGAIGLLSGSVGTFLLKRRGMARGLAWVSAAVFVALAVRLALAEAGERTTADATRMDHVCNRIRAR